ncbi:Hypothetical protein R9X50_00104700 [Acrodontium crateriforme]|uniref:Uncharacterized protein n=1 Tax=Acrodontium crateriforme TaxID=150365 RepID=A0AAQ3R7R7_9PEZI|nr:Hypothetical protein R9X50_00104700 [Acrodontium crateriforme]
MALTTPSAQDAIDLFKTLEEQFPSNLGADKWQILAISAITGGGHAEYAGHLYNYLIAKPEYTSPEQRKGLVRRLREALVKLVSVVGVPKPIEATFSIGANEREEDKDYSFSREHWQSGEANRKRGGDWLAQIYKHNDSTTQEMMAAHKDIRWLSIEITYGLYLSDHSILDGVDTELVVLSGIMIQNLARETGWHLRGTRRIGVSFDDVEKIQQCIEKVAEFCGLRLTRVPRVKDIEHEV